jgi:Zn-dependent alcohol dehydrogenase
VDTKLDAALRFGATHALNPLRDDAVAEIRSLTGGRGVDYAFDASGAVPAIEQGARVIRRGGTLVLVGIPATGTTVPFAVDEIADGALRILGTKMGAVRPEIDIPRLVELYRQGRLLLDELISGRWPLDAINDAIGAAERGDALRPLVVY